VGAAVGGKFALSKWTATQLGDPVGFVPPDASSPTSFDPAGVRAGGYVGYNWQTGPWVYGVEFDAAWSDATVTKAGLPGCAIECFPGFPGPGGDSAAVKLGWDASARVRLGHLITPDILLYATGGAAWQNISASGTCSISSTAPFCDTAPPFTAMTQTDSVTLPGWTVGAGVESRFLANWLVRAEYRYAQFQSWNDTFWVGQPAFSPGDDAYHHNLKLETHIVTFGLAYQFNWNPTSPF